MAEPVRRRRSEARANRTRIIDAAIGAFAADPDASMDDVARAAGVVRRTVYAHFPSREALVEGIADEASAALVASFGADIPRPERPDLALAVLALLTWPVGDRFRMLLTFARKELGEQRMLDLMEPARAPTIALVEQGQRDGLFSSYLPAGLLVAMTEAVTMTLLDQANKGGIRDSGESFGVTSLVLLGVPPERAAAVVEEAWAWIRDTGGPSVPTAGPDRR
ncbi:TetR/AcrR family transcriptional regulator [Rhodococcus sp. UNC363MFTsu5.1]|uniref:TetR/AcrR family transcriptional regulator n=1 Tax=Rhodococcus sp. UNC363MFTsu5.1 TaxID=1449069 RepID=UPI0009DD20BF|nr:TetR/AcrR family transcriptional regulator [Rhodococcus sp. UNC363MFTsu5.1]